MRTVTTPEQRARIVELHSRYPEIRVMAIAARVGVSDDTVRRGLVAEEST